MILYPCRSEIDNQELLASFVGVDTLASTTANDLCIIAGKFNCQNLTCQILVVLVLVAVIKIAGEIAVDAVGTPGNS